MIDKRSIRYELALLVRRQQDGFFLSGYGMIFNAKKCLQHIFSKMPDIPGIFTYCIKKKSKSIGSQKMLKVLQLFLYLN
jgi:hypothetical protein